MRFTRIVVLIALAALTAGSVGSAGTKTIALSSTPSSGCKILAPPAAGPSPTNTVTVKGECYKAGRTILTVVSYSYQQTDYSGAQCGATVSNKIGRNFTPRLKNTFYVLANFTVAPKYKSSGIKPKSTGWVKMAINHWQTQCGKLDPANPPSPSNVCQYSFTTPDTCGQLIIDNDYNGPTLPQWGGKPLMIGGVIYTPSVLSSSAVCKELAQGPKLKLLGQVSQFATWSCAGEIVVSPQITMFYYPPGSSTVCAAPNRIPGQTLAGVYTHVTLPPDWQKWGGRLAVVYEAKIYNDNGRGPVSQGETLTVGHEYSDAVFSLKGAENACAELTSST